MVTLSTKVRYAVAALRNLGSRYGTGEWVQVRTISDTTHVPQQYLEQILVLLRRAGLVESLRGAQGGYHLTRTPAMVRLTDIVAAIEGPVHLAPEDDDTGLGAFWDFCTERVVAALDVTLEDVDAVLAAASDQAMYQI